ncbi:MAG: AAA family ATPase [Armatimonadia bacterium]|nr:AAA family ATPase [Armatimonadia bacterium]
MWLEVRSVNTLAIVSRKGGVGKTTVSINLAASLAKAGHTTALIDLESQAAATVGMGIDYTVGPTVAHVLLGEADLPSVLHEAHGVQVAPGSQRLSAVERMLQAESLPAAQYPLPRYIDQLAEADVADWCIIDTPPSLGLLTLNALAAADHCVGVATAEYASVEAILQTLEMSAQVRQGLNPSLQLLGVVINEYHKVQIQDRHVVKRLEDKVPLLRPFIRDTQKVSVAYGFREPVVLREPSAVVSIEYRRLTKGVISRVEESARREGAHGA